MIAALIRWSVANRFLVLLATAKVVVDLRAWSLLMRTGHSVDRRYARVKPVRAPFGLARETSCEAAGPLGSGHSHSIVPGGFDVMS